MGAATRPNTAASAAATTVTAAIAAVAGELEDLRLVVEKLSWEVCAMLGELGFEAAPPAATCNTAASPRAATGARGLEATIEAGILRGDLNTLTWGPVQNLLQSINQVRIRRNQRKKPMGKAPGVAASIPECDVRTPLLLEQD